MQNINDITALVPPSHHFRVTIDFWTFVNDPTKLMIGANASASNIIYTDFLSLTFYQNGSGDNDIYFTCIPIEFIFDSIKGTTTKTQMITIINGLTNNATKLTDTVSSAANLWFFTRCAFSFQHSQAYINQQPITPLLIPKLYSGQSSFNYYFKKFYRSGSTVNLLLQGFANNLTPIYIRNLNVFREFLPQNMDLKYL